MMRRSDIWKLILAAILILVQHQFLPGWPVRAGDQAVRPPLAIDWSATSLLSVNDDWSGVQGVEGYLGQNLTTQVGADPRTLLTTSTLANDLDLLANQSNPNGLGSGGVAEFDGLADPTIALQGSATADAPYLLLHLDTSGLSELTISYRLRDLDGSADDALQPVALQYRVGNTGNFVNIPEGYVADATSGPGLATLETLVSAPLPAPALNRPLVQVRIITANALGNDEWVGIDDLVLAAAGATRLLSIDDVARAEGDSGTTSFNFTVRLSAPAGAEGVGFDIATADGSARVADGDYVERRLSRQTIPAGSASYSFEVPVNGDGRSEPDEEFQVDVTAVTGAVVVDGRGVGTIRNDDFALVSVHDIQGPGGRSPLVGATVRTRGVVTGRKSTGFFIQETQPDGDPLTSEGIFVYLGSTPPAAAAAGNLVDVTGQVAEYVPTNDPFQLPLTQLTQPQVTLVAAGQSLPEPVVIGAANLSPRGQIDQLEPFEGMRVTVASLTVCAPTQGTIGEANATASSNGVFFGVVTGIARPFREPGIQAPDLPPAGTIPPIPRFDSNPERLRVDSNELVGALTLNYAVGTVVTGLTGPLDYAFRSYTLLPEPGATPVARGGALPQAAPVPADDELTIATFNLQRLYDTSNDPAIAEPVLTATAFANRLGKASLAIREYLRAPDILGVVEVENLATLQALATRISDDAIAAGQPDPGYAAWLVEGNDVGGIDVGFLVRTAPVVGPAGVSTPRVTVVAVVQELAASRLVNPDGSTDLLNDRPPLRLMAVVNHAAGGKFPVTVIVNHLRSLGGVGDTAPGSNGWATNGDRVRAKRQRQAEDLARLVQRRQQADPTERIVLVGDFNAFEFNDGFTDSIGAILGRPSPDNQTVVPGDGVDLVEPDLVNLGALAPPGERYSYSFDGNAQSLDHLLINQALVTATQARRVEHPRLNADFPETARNDVASPLRLSDHDPLVGYFRVAGFTDNPAPNLAGPGVPSPFNSILPGPQPGSVLIFNAYSSAVDRTHDSAITLTNTSPDRAVNVRLFLVDGQTGAVENLLLALTPNQTILFLASDLDPGTTGFIIAVAVNDQGCPTDFNQLIGEAQVRFETGHAASLTALAIPAISSLGLLCQPDASSITLRFDGVVYQMLPRTVAVNSIPSRLDGARTLLVLNRLGGDLLTGILPLGSIDGSLYNDLEARWDFSVNSAGPQLRGILSSANFPRTSLRFENVIPAGRTGWMRIQAAADLAIGGAVFYDDPTGFVGGHNLHLMTLSSAAILKVPGGR